MYATVVSTPFRNIQKGEPMNPAENAAFVGGFCFGEIFPMGHVFRRVGLLKIMLLFLNRLNLETVHFRRRVRVFDLPNHRSQSTF